MAKIKMWTSDDRECALKWLHGKGVVLLKNHLKSTDDFLSEIRTISDPEIFGQTVTDALTVDWLKRMLNAIRQQKFSAKKPVPATATATATQCETLKKQLEDLRDENDGLRLIVSVMADFEVKLADLEDERVELLLRIEAADTLTDALSERVWDLEHETT